MLAISSVPLFAQQPSAAPVPQFRTSQPPPILDYEGSHRAGFTGTEGLTNVPNGAFEEDRVGIRQSTLFRNTSFPNGPILNLPAVSPTLRGESVTANFKLTLPSLSGGLPWMQRGFEPQDADLKLGPFFFKLRALEAAVLHSDNINLTPDNRESGTVAYIGLTVGVIAQITESLRIATAGTFVYLPIEGKGGVAGFGVADIYDFGFVAGPAARAQIAWDTEIGGWHVVFMDDFQIAQGVYSDDYRSNDVLFEGGGFDTQSRAGRYSLGPRQATFRNRGEQDHDLQLRDDVMVYSNLISAEAEHLNPGSILLRARIYHEDLWYNQGNRGLPSLREGATISLISERENMRFRPYFIYDAFRTNRDDSIQNIFRLGIVGPITDQLHLRAEAGYYTGGRAGEGMLWRVQLDHTAGPYTHESLIYVRQFNYFHDEINEGVGYNLWQVLGPKLHADAYAYRLRSEDFFSDDNDNDDDNFARTQWLLGLRLTYNVGPKTTLRLTGEYASSDPDGTKLCTGRAELGYNFTDTLLLRFHYQYQKSTSRDFDRNYTENLFFLSITKYFD